MYMGKKESKMDLRKTKYAFGMLVSMAAVACLILCLAYFFYAPAFSWKIGLMAVVFFSVSFFGILMLDHFAKKGERTLISGYMAVRGIKLVVLVAFLLILFIIDRDSAKWVAASFILFYIAMLIFDSVYFTKKLKK